MALEESHTLRVAPHWRLTVVDSHRFTHLRTTRISQSMVLQMVTVRIQLDRTIEELLERRVHSHVVLGRHHIVVLLPIVNLLEVLLKDERFLNILSYLLNQPTEQT